MRKHLFCINLFIIILLALLTTLCSVFTFSGFITELRNSPNGYNLYFPNIVLYPVAAFIFWSSFVLVLIFSMKFKLVAKIINLVTASLSQPFAVIVFIYTISLLDSRRVAYYQSELGSMFPYAYPTWGTFAFLMLFLGLAHIVFSILLIALRDKDNSKEVAVSSSEKPLENKPSTTGDVLETLKQLKELLNNNAITEDEYEVLKQKELNKM